jgi:hypothetical protein
MRGCQAVLTKERQDARGSSGKIDRLSAHIEIVVMRAAHRRNFRDRLNGKLVTEWPLRILLAAND